MVRFGLLSVVFVSFVLWGAPLEAAEEKEDRKVDDGSSPLLRGLSWRCIGPARGGRVSSVAGVRGDRRTYYMGACGGGVWKTSDAGHSWRNVSDKYFKTGSVGAVCVAPSDANVVYVGMGEPDPRGNFSHGDGVYRTTDAGKTWKHLGLKETRQIGRIAVHPSNPDVVFVAALGHIWGPNKERGVYRSTDGGATWQRVHHVGSEAGAVDVCIDPFNPRVVYAGFWQVSRKPWRLDSGGKGSGLFRSTDGGDTWHRLKGGLPQGVTGKTCVSASAARRGRVFAMVEAEQGGLFRSDDGGDSWRRVNDERKLRQRAWYYSRVEADPQDPDTVYVLNVRFHRSTDGGKVFTSIRTPHVDNHALWIDPDDNQRMVEGNDGGANVSFDAGKTWSRQDNQPTAQFYRVTTDNHVPYRVLGSQQDNSTCSISSASNARNGRNFDAVGGGEAGYIAVKPDDPDIVYGGSYAGFLTRHDRRTGLSRSISPWPENVIGHGCADHTHRFQWTFPIVFSPHDANTLYVGGEVLFRTTDEGQSWDVISPDLTTNDKKKQASSGGPITQDNTTVEYYCTIFSVAESPRKKGRIWVGTDDGKVHVTDDAPKGWDDVTPEGLGADALISLVEASPHDSDSAFLAVNRYRSDDFAPYVFHTRDRGQTWAKVVRGLPDGAFVRTVREDPERAGLLYAGTETGVYVSFDSGGQWQSLQLDLPVVPVTDVTVKDDDLVIATQGRSFWILSGLSRLRQLRVGEAAPALFAPAPVVRSLGRARIHYHLDPVVHKTTLSIATEAGAVVRSWDVKVSGGKRAERKKKAPKKKAPKKKKVKNPKGKKDGATPEGAAKEKEQAKEAEEKPSDSDARRRRGRRESKEIRAEPGMNVFAWNLRRVVPTRVPGAVGWPGLWGGPRVLPGTYVVTLTVGDESHSEKLIVRPDPRWGAIPAAGYEASATFTDDVYATLDAVHRAVNELRDLRKQVQATMKQARRAGVAKKVRRTAKKLTDALDAVEEALIQRRSKAPQDPLNYPVRLNDKLTALLNQTNGHPVPTAGMQAVRKHLNARVHVQLQALKKAVDELVPVFNKAAAEAPVPALVLDPKKPTEDDAGSGGLR